MQVSSELRLQEDSHLFVMLSGGVLSFLLVEANYETLETDVETFEVLLPSKFSLSDLDELIADSLTLWQEEVGWDVLDCEEKICVTIDSSPNGVGGYSLLMTEDYYDKGYRSNVLGMVPTLVGDESHVKAVVRIKETLEASDVISVTLNWDHLVVHLVQEGHVQEFRIEQAYLRKILRTTMPNLLSTEMQRGEFEDLFENLSWRRPVHTNASVIVDVLRSYVTAALYGIKDARFRKFGIETPDAYVLISGDLARVIPEKYLLLAVVDGLQLRGRFRVAMDDCNRSTAGGAALSGSKGTVSENDKKFIFPIGGIYPHRYIYLGTEKGGSGRFGEQAFKGVVRSRRRDGSVDRYEQLIIGQAGQLHTFMLSGEGSVRFEPGKSVFFPNMAIEGKELNCDYGKLDDAVIFDCRSVPIVYGPDANSNHKRISGWVRGLSIENEAADSAS